MSWFRRPPARDEIEEELRFHLEEKERRLIADGLSPAAARREARKAFGSQAAVREYTRDAWIFRWADDLWRDLKFAARGLRRSPGFTAVAVLTLALGIGANATIFSFVNALLLRDLPVQNPKELVWFGTADETGSWSDTQSYRLYDLLKEDRDSFAGVTAVGMYFASMATGEETRVVLTHFVTEEYFSVLGVRPALGRLLGPDDLAGLHGRVAVLRYGFWQDRFGSDKSILGRTITLAGRPYAVAGVAARGFAGTDATQPTDVWLTADQAPGPVLETSDWKSADNAWMKILCRLRPGVTLEQAQASAALAYQRTSEERLALHHGPRLAQLKERLAGASAQLRPAGVVNPAAHDSYVARFVPLSVAVGLLFLICCANVANLLLGRGMRRRHEFGVRLATGASRRRLVQQLFTEGLLLALIGGLLGLLIASASWSFFGVQLTNTLLEPAPDETVIAFAAAISVFGMALFSTFPTLDASRFPLLSALRGGTALGGEVRGSLGSRGWLTAVQLALCLPLMVGAGLLIQTVDNLFSQDMGMDRSQRIKAQLNLTFSGYDGERAGPILDQLLSSLQSQPGLESVGYSAFGTLGASYAVDSDPLEGTADAAITGFAWFTLVSEGYFEALGIPLLTGRDFSSRDVDGAPRVTIVNETFARKFFAGRSPIGLRIHGAEVVGMVADAKYSDLRSDPEPQYYFAYRQSRWALPQMSIYARTPMSVEDFSAVIRNQVGRLDPYLLVDGIETMDGLVEGRLTEERAMSTLLTTFGLLALVISAIGLYGVILFDVTRRTREVGLRKALGARSTDIFRMVFRRAAPWVLGGCIVGLAGAAAMTRLLEAKLFGVGALDPLTFASATAFLLLCAAAANYLPARRAAAVEPMTALRHD